MRDDQIGLLGPQDVIAEPQTAELARPEILDHHVAFRDQPENDADGFR